MSDRPDVSRPLVGRYHHNGQPTELEAAIRVAPRTGTQRAAVLQHLRQVGQTGSTDYETWCAGIGARPHVGGTRREELIADGWPIFDSGERRLTDTGSRAIVWVLQDCTEGADPPREAEVPHLMPVSSVQLSLVDAA